MSTLFVAERDYEWRETFWSERHDGHFCGFHFPHVGYPDQPAGFGVRLSSKAIAWDCPYWLMAAVWLVTFLLSYGRRPLTIKHLFVITTAVAVAFALIASHCALLLTLSMNLVTAGWLIVHLCLAVAAYVRGLNSERHTVNTDERERTSECRDLLSVTNQ
ncbi:MAG: hypothetical protein R3E01_22490 [Pirellulaceae bacterium]|nr:hypothetical protein [Planctomycetales bacterium]